MTAEQAHEIAENCFASHPAAAPLMIEAIHGATLERRERSRLALRLLDPVEPLDYLSAPGGPAWTAALAIAFLLVANLSLTRDSRRRVSGLLAVLCSEAARLREHEAAA